MSKAQKTETDLSTLTFDELSARVAAAGGQRALSRETGVPRTTIQELLRKAYDATFKHRPAPQARIKEVGEGVRRFILTSAQDETQLHHGFLTALERYRDWLSLDAPCEIMRIFFWLSTRKARPAMPGV